MLVQFMVRNVLSFKEETILDMTAIHAYKEHACNLIEIGPREKFIRVAAIYGANASGKSNLCCAMKFFQQIIRRSMENMGDNGRGVLERYYVPFSFETDKNNSEFQIIEILDDGEYSYGFEYDDEHIAAEWLYKKNLETNRKAVIFERTTENVTFGASVRKQCDIYKDQIPVDALVLSFFNKLRLKADIFRKVYEGIMDTLVLPSDFCEDTDILDRYLPYLITDEKEKLVGFLRAIDSGIKDIICHDIEKEIEFFTVHQGKDGKDYTLDLFDESEGTIKSIMLYICARAAIWSDSSMFVDELNIKLHPLLLKFIVDLFYEQASTAQLIYTTHDTTLMDKRFFRRDQIWFVQKDEYGYSDLVALSDFKIRSDASFEKDYLAGVYGGIPLLKEFAIKEEG